MCSTVVPIFPFPSVERHSFPHQSSSTSCAAALMRRAAAVDAGEWKDWNNIASAPRTETVRGNLEGGGIKVSRTPCAWHDGQEGCNPCGPQVGANAKA